MKLSQSFWKTLKENPADAEIPSHRLMMRAGLISKAASGLYNHLPFAIRSLKKIEGIIRQELEKINAQEVSMSFVTPSSLWEESGRWTSMGAEMVRFTDRKGMDFCLSPTNEEAVVDIFRNVITSYKDLPVNLYQIKTKVRDELRPRFGLMRCKEFSMKDAYTFSLDKASLDEQYDNYFKAYERIFQRIGLEFMAVEADGGNMASGNARTHEFQVLADSGEDSLVVVPSKGVASNQEKAQTLRVNLQLADQQELEEISTPDMQTCADVAQFLKVPVEQTLKTLIYRVHFAKKSVNFIIMLLGDDEVNEVKLKNVLKCEALEPADAETLKELNLPKGYMGPYQKQIATVIDSAVDTSKSYIVGANKEGFHLKGFCPNRDLEKTRSEDIRMARELDVHTDGESALEFRRGIEVGHIFQLGDKYTKSMKVGVLDHNGKKVTPLMGCYGIGVTRTMAAAIEQHHDDNGIIWPAAIAPFQVYFAVIGKKDETKKLAHRIYENLQAAGIEVLFDDRGMGPGPMFKDADLLGLPLRVVLGERDFEKDKTLEVKTRAEGKVFKVTEQNLLSQIQELL